MKTIYRFFLVTVLVGYGFSLSAQFTVIVFSPKGEKFTLYVNGTEQNREASYRVEADNPGGPTFKLRVFFADPSIKEINKTIFNKPGNTMFYKVDKNPKGVFVLESTSSEWFDPGVVKDEKTEAVAPAPAAKAKEEKAKPASSEEKSPAKKGCDNPMSDPDFTASLVAVSTAPFDPMKLSNAKKIADNHCITVMQVVMALGVFDSESTRLSFAKYAYDHTYNQSEYDDVKEALHSQKSRDDLDRYIASKK